MKSIEKEKAIELRHAGMSVGNIAAEIGVSKSSVCLWVRNVPLTPEQLEKLYQANPVYNGQHKGGIVRQAKALAERIKFRQEGAEQAKKKEWLHSFGCALYWGEGAKSRTTCKVTNSNSELLKTFIKFLNVYFPGQLLKLTIQCYTGNGITVEQIEKYWSDTLGITNIGKTMVNQISRASLGKKPKNHLVYGTATVIVHNVKVVQHIYGALEEYGNFKSELGLH